MTRRLVILMVLCWLALSGVDMYLHDFVIMDRLFEALDIQGFEVPADELVIIDPGVRNP